MDLQPAGTRAGAVTPVPRVLFGLMLAALLVRLAIWPWFTGLEPRIYDEDDYVELATSLARDGEFAMNGRITSARPPFYPAVVAVIYRTAGLDAHQTVRLFQILLNVAIVPLVFALGRHLYDQRTGLWAAGFAAFYPSLWGHDYLILTEVPFTFLLVAGTLAAVADAARPRWPLVAVAGIAFGLGALTRTTLLLYPPLFAITTFAWRRAPSVRRIATVTLFTAAFALTISPWIVRNTRLNGRLSSIDSYSNSTAARLSPLRHLFEKPGATWAMRPARERDGTRMESEEAGARALSRHERLDLSQSSNEPARRSEAAAAGTASDRAANEPPEHFSVHLRRALNGLLWDGLLFWRIDREIAAAAVAGRLGAIPRPVTLALTALIAGYYVVLALAATAGLFLRPPQDRFQLALLLSVVAILFVVHTFSVGHSRYHVPLMPLLAVFAARLWVARGQPMVPRRVVAALAASAVLIATWTAAFVRYDLADIRNKLERSERRPADARID